VELKALFFTTLYHWAVAFDFTIVLVISSSSS
jgi:hypothetical protein